MAPSSTNNDVEYEYHDTNHDQRIYDHDKSAVQIEDRGSVKPATGKDYGKELVHNALNERIKLVNQDTCEAGDEDTFFVADLGEVYRQHLRWKMHLSRVKPHYAVKCNPDPTVLRLLASLETGFDCASKGEIETVLALGVDPSRIIYAQPCKTNSYIRYAAQVGVKQMTFDNADELYKIKRLFPGAELFLRISTDDSASLCRLSLKFGAAMDQTKGLLQTAKDLELNVTGVAFHVGSGASDPAAYTSAVKDARAVFDTAQTLGFDMRTLDVGGGFIYDTFEPMASVLSDALAEHFPPHIRIIGEPGRFYVSGAFTIACNVIARRTVEDPQTREKSYMLYLNDGVYGNFSSIMFDHQHPVPQILSCSAVDKNAASQQKNKAFSAGLPTPPTSAHPSPDSSQEDLISSFPNLDVESAQRRTTTYSIWGPTCDGIDCISPSVQFPANKPLDVGDWLFFEEMGAYTKCSATRFNGFTDRHDTVYVCSEGGVGKLAGF